MSNTQRYVTNLDIIAQFKKGTVTNELLKGFSGWGGLKKAIEQPEIYNYMNTLLTHEEISSLKKTITNGYYTPAPLVKFMYDWLLAYGFKAGSILEPAIGQGVFIEHMSQSIRNTCQITAVEIDKLTSQMVQTLYSDISLINTGFEKYQPDQKFDLVIGNPPYGVECLVDHQHPDLNRYRIHHYFVVKSMRLLLKTSIHHLYLR